MDPFLMMMSQKDIVFDDTHGSNHNAYLILLFQVFLFSLKIFLVIYMMFLLLNQSIPSWETIIGVV